MLTVDITLPDVEELHKLVTEGQEKGFLSYDEIVTGIRALSESIMITIRASSSRVRCSGGRVSRRNKMALSSVRLAQARAASSVAWSGSCCTLSD